MTDTIKRRRIQDGSTVVPFRSSQIPPMAAVQTVHGGAPELAACGAVAIVALTLIALIWSVTTRELQEQQIAIRDRAEQSLSSEAASIAETIAHELLMIDQSLAIIQSAWRMDSGSVDLGKWQTQMPALTAMSDHLFICDEKHIIQQDNRPNAVGQGIGAACATLHSGSLERFKGDGTTATGESVPRNDASAPIDVRQSLMYVVRPLDHPKDWLVGASFRSSEVTRLFAQAGRGADTLVALVDTRRGDVQAVVGPAARQPETDVSISKSPLFAIIRQSVAGSWTGDTAIDGVERLHTFHQIADRDVVVLMAANMAEVMAPAYGLAAGARTLAFVATALVVVIGGTIVWEFSTVLHRRRLKRTLNRNKSELDRLRAADAKASENVRLAVTRFQMILDHSTDGVALLDTGLRLIQWNDPFGLRIGIEPRRDMKLDRLLREQAEKGLFGAGSDLEGEIERRTMILRTGDAACVSQVGPYQETMILRGQPIEDGGLILFLRGLASREPPAVTGTAGVLESEPAPSAPIEW